MAANATACPVTDDEADIGLNAVERMADAGDRVVSFFDRVHAPAQGLAHIAGADFLHATICDYASGQFSFPGASEYMSPAFAAVLTPERVALIDRWQSAGAARIATKAAITAGIERGVYHGAGADIGHEGIEVYCDILAERERILESSRWHRMVSAVASESLSALPAAQAVRQTVQGLWNVNPKASTWPQLSNERQAWLAARKGVVESVQALRDYAAIDPQVQQKSVADILSHERVAVLIFLWKEDPRGTGYVFTYKAIAEALGFKSDRVARNAVRRVDGGRIAKNCLAALGLAKTARGNRSDSGVRITKKGIAEAARIPLERIHNERAKALVAPKVEPRVTARNRPAAG